jgi:phospholipid/cholesterol/gamma-HCH transport system substrate-binding protein
LNELKVGLFALASIVSVIFMSIKVTQNQSGFGSYISYKTVVDDAAGIFTRSPIRVAGINAGRIKEINLNKNQAIIEFEVLEEVSVSKDSILKIRSVGFLGDKYLEIYMGESKERLPEGSLIPSISGGGMEDLTKDAGELIKDLKDVMVGVKEALAPENGMKPLVDIRNNIVTITEDIKEVTGSIKSLITTNEGKLNDTLDNIYKVSKSLEFHLNEINKESLMSDFKKIGPVLDDIKSMSNDLKLVVSDLKAGKGTIGRLLRDDKVIDQVSETIAGVQRMVNKVDSIQTELSLFTAVNTETDNKSDLALRIYPSPERFYHLGITTSEYGPVEETEYTNTVNNVQTRELRSERKKDSFRFNIQIGRKIQNWSFRAGLIESSGGIGVDYWWPNAGTEFTFEVFDYREDLGPNLRLASSIHLWNVFYLKLALEDLVSKNNEQSATLGAGLKFTDEDLKGLIGFFL